MEKHWEITIGLGIPFLIILVLLVWLAYCFLQRRRRRCTSQTKLSEKTAIITGANSGIGKATALNLSLRGARVIIACRDLKKGEESASEISEKSGVPVLVRQLDLSSLSSVRRFCRQILQEEPKLDILINNAGVFRCPYAKTEDGFEMQMGVNHLGHFALTNGLLNLLKSSAPSRVVNVSSFLYTKGNLDFGDFNCEASYDRTVAYCNSKLANAFFTRELSRRVDPNEVSVYCVNPGIVRTNLLRHSVPSCIRNLQPYLPVFQNADDGSQTVVYCAVSEDIADESGFYYEGCRRKRWNRKALDDEVAKRLWEFSEALTNG